MPLLQNQIEGLPIGHAFALDILTAGQLTGLAAAAQLFEWKSAQILSLPAHMVVHKNGSTQK
jgi:hypothetical protein